MDYELLEVLEEEYKIVKGSLEEWASEEDEKLVESFERVIQYLKDVRG